MIKMLTGQKKGFVLYAGEQKNAGINDFRVENWKAVKKCKSY
jgi:hypothetical protein